MQWAGLLTILSSNFKTTKQSCNGLIKSNKWIRKFCIQDKNISTGTDWTSNSETASQRCRCRPKCGHSVLLDGGIKCHFQWKTLPPRWRQWGIIHCCQVTYNAGGKSAQYGQSTSCLFFFSPSKPILSFFSRAWLNFTTTANVFELVRHYK